MKGICPRCHKPFSYIETRKTEHNEYRYAVHVKRKGGKRRIKKCYLGPADGYKYVVWMLKEV